MTGAICVEASSRLAFWVSEKDRVQVFQLQVWFRGILRRGMGSQFQRDAQLMDAILEVQRPISVPNT